jgi:putative addiction module component (TIGR02574 family)
MSVTCRDVLDAALQLSPEERGIVAERLLETLSPDDTERSDDELEGELTRRIEEASNDPSTTVSWTELREEQ